MADSAPGRGRDQVIPCTSEHFHGIDRASANVNQCSVRIYEVTDGAKSQDIVHRHMLHACSPLVLENPSAIAIISTSPYLSRAQGGDSGVTPLLSAWNRVCCSPRSLLAPGSMSKRAGRGVLLPLLARQDSTRRADLAMKNFCVILDFCITYVLRETYSY